MIRLDNNEKKKHFLTTMHAEAAIMRVQSLQRGNIRRAFDHLIHPLDPTHHFVSATKLQC